MWFQSYPFFFDLIATVISNIALILLRGSIQMMLKGASVVIFTFLISKYRMGNNHILDHYIAICFVFFGLIIVSLSAFFGQKTNVDNENKDNDLKIIGIIIVIFAMIFQSIHFCLEEYYMSKYFFDPFLYIGFEGIFGFIFNTILCIIFYFIYCDMEENFNKSLCSKDKDDNQWRLENVIYATKQIINERFILILIIFLIITLAIYNLVGININKYRGAMIRSLVENFRSILVWIFFLIPWGSENMVEDFNWIRLIGLIAIITGFFVYFELFKFEERRIINRKIRSLREMGAFEEGLKEDAQENMSVND